MVQIPGGLKRPITYRHQSFPVMLFHFNSVLKIDAVKKSVFNEVAMVLVVSEIAIPNVLLPKSNPKYLMIKNF